MDEQEGQDRKRDMRARTLKRMIERAESVKAERFDKVGDELARYGYGSKIGEKFDYQTWSETSDFGSKVAKTHEALQVLGPYLTPENPTRRLTMWPWSDEKAIQRAELMEGYLNYTPKEYGLDDEQERAVADMLVYGLGVLWHGLDPDKDNVVVSTHDSIKHYLKDGDARTNREVRWVGRKRYLPRHELLSRYPQHKRCIMSAMIESDRGSQDDEHAGEDTQAIIKVYEVYLKVGLGRYFPHDGQPDAEEEIDDAPKMYVLCGDTILDEDDWPVPFHLDGRWPCTEIPGIHNPNSIWPISPLESGLGWQRAINWCATQMVASFNWGNRQVIAVLEAAGITLSDEDEDAIINGADPVSVIRIGRPGAAASDVPPHISQVIQQLDLSKDPKYSMEMLEYFSDQHERATGVYDILYTGATDRQMRSAQEAQMRERHSTARLNKLKEQVRQALSQAARSEALVARYLLDPYDLRPIFGKERSDAWGWLMAQEQYSEAYWFKKYTDEGHMPHMVPEMVRDTLDHAVTLEDWLAEADYTIEVGDRSHKTPERRLEGLQEAMNQLVPTLAQSGDPRERSISIMLAAQFMQELDVDDDVIQRLEMHSAELMADYQQMMAQQQAMAQQQQMQPPAEELPPGTM